MITTLVPVCARKGLAHIEVVWKKKFTAISRNALPQRGNKLSQVAET